MDEGSGDAKTGGDHLSFDSSAFDADDEVYFRDVAKLLKGGENGVTLNLEGEVLFEESSIYIDDAIAAAYAYGGNCSFTATCSKCFFNHDVLLELDRSWVLGLHRVVITSIDAELF